jgi:hypothetical protein
MKIEQTSNLIKVPNRIIQGLVNAVVSAVKINSQEIATPSTVARRNHVDKRKQAAFQGGSKHIGSRIEEDHTCPSIPVLATRT